MGWLDFSLCGIDLGGFGAQRACFWAILLQEGIILSTLSWFGELKQEEPSDTEGLAPDVHTQMFQMIPFP